MAKPVHTSDAKTVVPEPFNSIIPGPNYKAESSYSNGEVRVGYGDSKTEAEKNSRDYSTSYHKSNDNKK